MADQTFDVQGALSAGASEDDILQHLTSSRSFDTQGAMKSGASKRQIIDYLAATPRKPAVPGMEKLGGQPPSIHPPQIESLQGPSDTELFGSAPPDPKQPDTGFLRSAYNQLPHPIDAVKSWINKPNQLAAASDAARQEREGHPEGQPDLSLAQGPDSPGALLNATAGPAVTAGQQAATGDIGGAAGSLAGGYGQYAAIPAARAAAPGLMRGAKAAGTGIKAAAPSLASGAAMMAAGEALGQVPGMAWPARIGLGYPGVRMMAHGAKKGVNAAREAWKDSAATPEGQAPVFDQGSGGSRFTSPAEAPPEPSEPPLSNTPPELTRPAIGAGQGFLQPRKPSLMAPSPAPPPPASTGPSPELLDGIAQGYGYKAFKNIRDPNTQATIATQAKRVMEGEAKKPGLMQSQPTAVPAPEASAPPPPPTTAPAPEVHPAHAANRANLAEAYQDFLRPEFEADPEPDFSGYMPGHPKYDSTVWDRVHARINSGLRGAPEGQGHRISKPSAATQKMVIQQLIKETLQRQMQ